MKLIKWIFLSALFLILIFLLGKMFILNRPRFSPQEIAISYLQAEQSSQRKLAEEYLFSDFEKVEILKKRYKEISRLNWIQKEETGQEPVFELKEIKISKNQARVKIFEKTNKKEGFIFFDYYLPKEITFETELTKVGNWKNGGRAMLEFLAEKKLPVIKAF